MQQNWKCLQKAEIPKNTHYYNSTTKCNISVSIFMIDTLLAAHIHIIPNLPPAYLGNEFSTSSEHKLSAWSSRNP